MSNQLDEEVERNLFAFLTKIPDLLPEHEGSFAVLKNREVTSIHKRLSDALKAAHSSFTDGIFSIQRVTERPQELGMFNSVDDHG